ncbi:NHS-like protein 3 isoform X1 [Scleropages formosus]|uniref:NHS like 3 n=1 Tax=Scleropages formosus TaxID=113540 RepID=A0A8C9V125_SCLFO|nr:uncharacterized protein KIAA1522 homolog isoform X1 [Scleropages formosus]
MSRRSSVGDLVPRDITEIFARESRSNKVKKKHNGSFSRALGWLRGTRKKKSNAGGGSLAKGSRPGESRSGKPSNHEQEVLTAASKPEDDRRLTVHFQSSPHYQENVFIEGSRPRYLEVLHSEAQEGLKILQQEEKQNGLDAESVSSTTTLGPGGGACQRERRGSLGSRSTTGDTASTASTRPALARQGSTFKPPNPVRRPEKLRRRSRRTTIMGIPHHVQKELGLERGVMLQPKMDGKVSNGGEGLPGIVVIPTIDGEVPTANHGGARVHLQNIELLQSSKEEQLLKHHIQQVYQEDVEICPANMRRPKSLAVPGLTTGGFLAEPQGPVMSISPQATYLSTIIPNAILPAAVDVIEINRSRSQSSVRTVGKSSLSASPASSRCAAARGPSSNRSHSQSSETVISNSSTISSKCSAQVPNGTEKDAEHGGPLASDRVSLCSATSWLSSASASTKQQAEMAPHGGREMNDGESQRSDGSFIRCLSVTKTKMPPAPPKRTYSLHQDKLKQRSQEILETDSNDSGVSSGKMSGVSGAKYSNAEEEALTQNLSASAGSPTDSTNSCSLDDSRSSVTSSALMSDQTVTPDSAPGSSESSPQKLPSRGNKFERTLSPSSGYSSQSGTPTLSAKEIHPPSPGNKKAKPTKPERMGSQASPAASISSSLTSLSSSVSETVHQDAQVNGQPSNIPKASPHSAVGADKVSSASRKVTLREELDIPPPPKVRAPFPPPPEIWMHNKRTFDLLCGSRAAATRLTMPQTRHPKAPSQDQKQETVNGEHKTPGTEKQREDSSETNKEGKLQSWNDPVSEHKPETSKCIKGPSDMENPKAEQTNLIVQQKQEPTEKSKDQDSLEACILTNQKREQESSAMLKKVPPPVMKKNSLMAHTYHPPKVKENLLVQKKNLPPEVETNPLLEEKMMNVQKQEALDKGAVAERFNTLQSMQTLSVDAPKVAGVSPPPSPPPAYHPPPPPSKNGLTASVSSSLLEDNQLNTTVESCWPPPPPPIEESPTPVFEEQDELDFPPPPPPVLQETLLDSTEGFVTVTEIQGTSESLVESISKTQPPVSSLADTPMAVKECVHEEELVTQSSTDSTANVLPVRPETSEAVQPRATLGHSTESKSQAPQVPHSKQMPLPLPAGVPPPPQEAPPPPPTVHNEILTAPAVIFPPALPTHVPLAPPLPEEKKTSAIFKRQPGNMNWESKSKDLEPWNRSSPVPKEDANIPLVTPSLLQMVRLRSVNVSDDQTANPAEDREMGNGSSPSEGQSQTQAGSQSVPQKPVRKSLSLKSPGPSGAAPSLRLQEAIRMKTAAMTSKDALPARLSLRSPLSSNSGGESGVFSSKPSEGGDVHKSPASTASFIFSRSTKKVVIETPTSPEAQSSLKQSLVAELMQVSDTANLAVADSKPSAMAKRPSKVPPPVARKPGQVSNNQSKLASQSEKVESSPTEMPASAANVQSKRVQPAGQNAHPEDSKEATSSTEAANTVEAQPTSRRSSGSARTDQSEL